MWCFCFVTLDLRLQQNGRANLVLNIDNVGEVSVDIVNEDFLELKNAGSIKNNYGQFVVHISMFVFE